MKVDQRKLSRVRHSCASLWNKSLDKYHELKALSSKIRKCIILKIQMKFK